MLLVGSRKSLGVWRRPEALPQRRGGHLLAVVGDVPKRFNELDPDREHVIQCKSGVRSARAADFLRSVGFTRVLNLKGGILDWVDKVDPSQPKY